MYILGLIIAFMLGGATGVFLLALVQINKNN